MRIAVASPSFCEHPVLRAELLALYPDAKMNTALKRMSGQELIDFLQGYDVAVVALEHMTADIIDALPDLKVISKLGTGVDMISAEAMSRRNIRLGWEPGANALSIAELVICFAILALRRVGELNLRLRGGETARDRMGRLLTGQTFGIHGCGFIGQQVVRLLAPFKCKVIAHDIVDRSAFYAAHNVRPVSFDELIATSDIVSVHVPLNTATANLYNATLLAKLKARAVVINTARGEIIDEAALKSALQSGQLVAACADVFADENKPDPELTALPNFFGTPHIGGSAEEARLEMGRIAIRGITRNFIPQPGVHPFA